MITNDIVPHPSEFIQREMDARGWTRDDLSIRMGGDAVLNRVALDLYFAIHDRSLRIGEEAIRQFATAFGVSEDYFMNLEKAWLDHPFSEIPTTAPAVRLVSRAN